MRGRIIIFRPDRGMTGAERSRFFREFYGYVDRSHYGKYRYKRKGLLDEVPHLSPARSVVIMMSVDAEKVISFLKSRDAEVFDRAIELEDEDVRKLGE